MKFKLILYKNISIKDYISNIDKLFFMPGCQQVYFCCKVGLFSKDPLPRDPLRKCSFWHQLTWLNFSATDVYQTVLHMTTKLNHWRTFEQLSDSQQRTCQMWFTVNREKLFVM